MTYNMKLRDEPFNSIKNGNKTIELRLNDEKRKNIVPSDTIVFTNIDTNERIKVSVIDVHKYDNFYELYKYFDKKSLGYKDDEVADPKDMEAYYSKEEQEKYKVVGIEIKLI